MGNARVFDRKARDMNLIEALILTKCNDFL